MFDTIKEVVFQFKNYSLISFYNFGLVCCEVEYVKRLLIIVRLLMTIKRQQHWEKLY